MDAYIGDLTSVVYLEVLRGAGLNLGVDPLGGAGVHYWGLISDRYKLPLTVVNMNRKTSCFPPSCISRNESSCVVDAISQP